MSQDALTNTNQHAQDNSSNDVSSATTDPSKSSSAALADWLSLSQDEKVGSHKRTKADRKNDRLKNLPDVVGKMPRTNQPCAPVSSSTSLAEGHRVISEGIDTSPYPHGIATKCGVVWEVSKSDWQAHLDGRAAMDKEWNKLANHKRPDPKDKRIGAWEFGASESYAM